MINLKADVPAVNSVRCKGGALLGHLMDEDTGAWWCERISVEVEVDEGSYICGEIGLTARGS